jgi:hypothetical protein
MTITEWESAGSKPGPYWVIADDGWAYWAEALKPDSATGLLLDNIVLAGEIDQEWYYAVEPVASFATLSDVSLLKADSDTAGQSLLDEITKPTVSRLEVYPGTNVTVDPGGSLQLTTIVYGENFPSQDVTYTLSDPAGSPTGATVVKDPATTIDGATGELTVGADELNTGFTVTVASVVDPTVTETIKVNVNVLSESFTYDLSYSPSDPLFGASNLEVILRIGDGDNNYIVDWGDGATTRSTTAHTYPTHTYAASSIRTITVSGRTLGGIKFCTMTTGYFGETRLIAVNTPLLEQSSTSGDRLFENCKNLASIPSDLFARNPQIIRFYCMFIDCYALTEIPSALFAENTEASNFWAVFLGCTGLTDIPSDLFARNTKATEFGDAFNACTNLETIPSDLFARNTKATTFYIAFSGCTRLETIPQGLFDNNTEVTNFRLTFNGCTNLQAIPSGLFDSNAKVTNFTGTFSGCTSLATIPNNLFDNNTKVTTFQNVFGNCTGIGSSTDLPDWWNTSKYPEAAYPQFYLTDANAVCMFTGCANARNYSSVPTTPLVWK